MKDEIIDMEDVMERVQNDRELLMELLDIFETDYAAKREMLNGCVAARDFGQMRDIAHSLKGAAGNISAVRLFSTCMQIEKLAEGDNLDGIDSLLENMDKHFKDLQGYIVKMKSA
jgi:HPt (histidine-containing phosphotransfer) domain-containing protein